MKKATAAILAYFVPLALLIASGEMLFPIRDGTRIVFCQHTWIHRSAAVVYAPVVALLPGVRFAKGDEPSELGI